MSQPARIIYAGSPDFAVPALEALLASGHSVVSVLTQPDRPAGRGRKLRPGPVKVAAEHAGLPVLQPATLRDPDIQNTLRSLQPDLLVVVAYGLLLPPEVLSIPRVACINLHASLLPRWRGASPIQMAILNGDAETGVCVMRMDEGLDTGPVYACISQPVNPGITAGELDDQLAKLGAALLLEELDPILSGNLRAQPQVTSGITHAPRIHKRDGIIDWSRSAAEISRQIRAYNPWPVAQTSLDGEQLRCWQAQLSADSAGAPKRPGTVLEANDAGIAVQTGNGVLLLTRVQLAGRKQLAANEFARARELLNVVLGT